LGSSSRTSNSSSNNSALFDKLILWASVSRVHLKYWRTRVPPTVHLPKVDVTTRRYQHLGRFPSHFIARPRTARGLPHNHCSELVGGGEAERHGCGPDKSISAKADRLIKPHFRIDTSAMAMR
jgi:hypothetical protein